MHPTAALLRPIRRLPLNTKQAGKDFYKGNRTGSMGRHTKHGGYIIDFKKVRTYICPDLMDFNVSNESLLRRDLPQTTLGGTARLTGLACYS